MAGWTDYCQGPSFVVVGGLMGPYYIIKNN